MTIFELMRHWPWLFLMASTLLTGVVMKIRIRKYIDKDPGLKQGYKKLIRGFIIWANIPWILLWIGLELGNLSLDDYGRPQDGNLWVLSFYVSLFLIWTLWACWLWFKRGAEYIVKHPGLTNLHNPSALRIHSLVCLAAYIIAVLILSTRNTTDQLSLTLPVSSKNTDVPTRMIAQPEYAEVPEPLENAWVMSSEWAGFMGVAIALSSNRYYYWFYSDVPWIDEPTYPITGDFIRSNNTLRIVAPQQNMYAKEWIITTNGGHICIWATKDVGDYARLMIPDPDFDPSNPFANQKYLSPTQE